jgi:hypothetical protein
MNLSSVRSAGYSASETSMRRSLASNEMRRQTKRGTPEGISHACASALVGMRAVTSSTTRMISMPTVDS